MSNENIKAILDLVNTDFKGVYAQGQVFEAKLYAETILYPTPVIPETEFKVLVKDLGDANVAAENGGDLELAIQVTACEKLHNAMGKKLIPYINSLWQGNKVNIEKSGAKVSAERSKVPPPDQPIISKIAAGIEPNSLKFYLVRGKGTAKKKRSKKQYRVFMFEKEDDAKGTEVGNSFDSRKLFAYDVPTEVWRYFGVRAENSGGSSLLSSKVKFFLLP